MFIRWIDSFRAFLRYFQNILERSLEDPEPTQGESRFTQLFTLKNVSSSFRVRSSLTSCIFHVTEDDIQLTLNYNLT